MKKLLEAKENEILDEYGFFVVYTKCGKRLNICLANLEQDEKGCIISDTHPRIIYGDGGFSEGTCGDANEEAIKEYGYDETLKFLLQEARDSSIELKTVTA